MIKSKRGSTAFKVSRSPTCALMDQLKNPIKLNRNEIILFDRNEKHQFLKMIMKNRSQKKNKSNHVDETQKQEYECQYDQEVSKSMRKKFPPNYHTLMNKSRLQAFLCEKRQLDKKKRFGPEPNQKAIKAIPQGTLSIMINKAPTSKEFEDNYDYIPQKSKFKMKWKVIQWLTEHKSGKFDKDNGGILRFNLKQFEKLFNYVQLGGDQGLTNKLFYILDTEKNGLIDSRELVTSMEMLMNQTIDQKIKNYIEMCSEDDNKNINPEELFNVMKFIFQNTNEKIKLKMIIKKIFNYIQCKKLQFSKSNVQQMAIHDQKLRQILFDSIDNIRKIEFLIENDLEPPFYINNTISNINGTYFRQQDCLINLMQVNYQFASQKVDNWKLEDMDKK